MRKLVCTKCNEIWYTANTQDEQFCNYCGAILIEESSFKKDKENLILTIYGKGSTLNLNEIEY